VLKPYQSFSFFWFSFGMIHSLSTADLELVDAECGFEDGVELSLMAVIQLAHSEPRLE
jgi:hypothetical protein